MVKKHMQRAISLMAASVMLAGTLTGCGGADSVPQEQTQGSTAQNEPKDADQGAEETDEPAMDLGGMEILIGDWWSSGEEAEPTTAQEEATQEYRRMIQEKYNFTIKQVALGSWEDHQETFTMSTMAEDPKAQVFLMDAGMVAQPMANNLFYDLATLENIDVHDEKWNASTTTLMSQGDSVYGLSEGAPQPRLGVFWNKRIFKEAGLDPDLPYDLQADGEWTWEKFEELCSKLTIDRDNDGTTDSYAMASFSVDFFKGAVMSNNADWIGKDESGKYVNKTSEPEFLEAMQWGRGLIDKGYEMPSGEGANWDWFISAFHDGKVAMTAAEQHRCSVWKDMEDDYGFVMFPKGPKGDGYRTNVNENVAVIPACYDKETAEKIAFAYNLYTEPTPGYEEDDDWKNFYYAEFPDERAVDETLTMMREPENQVAQYISVVYGVEIGDIVYNVYGGWATPIEEIERAAGIWQAALDDANKNLQ